MSFLGEPSQQHQPKAKPTSQTPNRPLGTTAEVKQSAFKRTSPCKEEAMSREIKDRKM